MERNLLSLQKQDLPSRDNLAYLKMSKILLVGLQAVMKSLLFIGIRDQKKPAVKKDSWFFKRDQMELEILSRIACRGDFKSALLWGWREEVMGMKKSFATRMPRKKKVAAC